MPLHERLEGAARLEQRDQLPGPGRIVAVEREGRGVAGGDDAHRRRGTLEQQPESDELVRVAVGHGGVGGALEEVGAVAEILEEGARPARDGAPVRAPDEQEQLVDRLPHLARDLLAHRARVLARERDAVDHRVRVALVPEHPVAHVDRGRLVEVLRVALLVAEQLHDLEPRLTPIVHLHVEQRVEVHVEDARDVLCALDVARRPVQRLGDPAQHQASTQVSLLPPPCDELTTSEPSRSAVRVRPPGTMCVAPAPERTKGRRSMWQPSQLAVHEGRMAGEGDRRLRDVVPRVLDDQAPERVPLGGGRGRPDQHPVATRLVDRLHDQLLEVVEDVGQVGRVGRVVGGHVREDRLLVEVEADHLGHVRVDRLVVGHTRADRIRERHVAGPVGVQQSRHPEQAVLPEGERIEEVVVDPAIDHVHALQAARGAVEDAVLVDDEVARLHDLDPHLPGQVGVLEVGGVVRPRREQDDARVAARGSRGDRAQRLEEPAGVLVDRSHPDLVEEHGEDALQRLAALEHVADPRRRSQVVLEHQVAAVTVPDQVDPADVRIDVPGHLEPDHLPAEVARAEDEVGRDQAGLEDLLPVVDVREEEVQGLQALDEASLDRPPFVRRDDPRHEVEREDPVGARIVAVHREPDPLREEERVRDPDPLLQLSLAHPGEPLREQPVVRARLPRALVHLVEERSQVVAGCQAGVGPGCDLGSDHGAVRVHPAPFTFWPVAAEPRA